MPSIYICRNEMCTSTYRCCKFISEAELGIQPVKRLLERSIVLSVGTSDNSAGSRLPLSRLWLTLLIKSQEMQQKFPTLTSLCNESHWYKCKSNSTNIIMQGFTLARLGRIMHSQVLESFVSGYFGKSTIKFVAGKIPTRHGNFIASGSWWQNRETLNTIFWIIQECSYFNKSLIVVTYT